MRLASATSWALLALMAAGCSSTGSLAPDDEGIKAGLAALGVEGRAYVHDLGDEASMLVRNVYADGGDFLIEDVHGHLTYVDGATLNVRWEYYGLDKPFTMPPSFTPSTITGIANSRLYVLTRSAGVPEPHPRWVDLIPSAAPVATDSTVYVPTYPTQAGNKTIYSVSLGSGYIGWGARTRTDVTSGMAKGGPDAGDTLYFATRSGLIEAYPTYLASERSPEPAWQSHAASGIRYDLTVAGDDLGVVTDDGRLICYDRVTGNARWEAYPPAGEYGESAAQFSESFAFFRRDGKLCAFNRETGAPLWSVAGGQSFIAQRGDTVLVMADKDWVIAVNAETGEEEARHQMPGTYFPAQMANDGTVTAITDDGLMVSVELGW